MATRTGWPRRSTSTTPRLAAARYLCRASHGLDADTGLRTAYFAYNHSLLYVDTVLRFARLYEDSVAVPARSGVKRLVDRLTTALVRSA